jgi:hypothetical protein
MALLRQNVAGRRRRCAGPAAAALVCIACGLVGLPKAPPVSAATFELKLPESVVTHADGRLPVQALYASSLALVARGWHLDIVIQSQPTGTAAALPIIALRSPRPGPAVWVLTGIHGEEPAGPNAVAAVIEDLAALGERMPMVLLPLCNPQGYARSWRYLNTPTYSAEVEGQSVGDSSHLLPAPADPARPRAARASSPEAAALTAYVLRTAASYPPLVSIDLHEDDLLAAGYVYSQGAHGAADPLAGAAVAVLGEHGIPIQRAGTTRFDEPIAGGIIGPVVDSSIDELLSAREVLVHGARVAGPSARTVLVFETPAAELALDKRVAAHAALLRELARRIAPQ